VRRPLSEIIPPIPPPGKIEIDWVRPARRQSAHTAEVPVSETSAASPRTPTHDNHAVDEESRKQHLGGESSPVSGPTTSRWQQLRDKQAAARTEESSNAVRVEQEASKEFRGLCQHAFLGRAKLKITLTRNKLMMRTYNPGRQVEQELVRYMVGMMSSGDCRSDSNPLTIAVDGGLIDQRTLTKEAGELTEVRFLGTGSVTLELLAGMHRVLAAREASKALRGRLEKLEKQLGDEADGEAGDEEYVEGEDRPPRDRQQEERTAAVERQLEGLKGMIESVETWPIQFYDIGGSDLGIGVVGEA